MFLVRNEIQRPVEKDHGRRSSSQKVEWTVRGRSNQADHQRLNSVHRPMVGCDRWLVASETPWESSD